VIKTKLFQRRLEAEGLQGQTFGRIMSQIEFFVTDVILLSKAEKSSEATR